ncbi:MAG: DUF523 domain-containing protein [Clostridia bacterium]|nr:DUF523 domain-containing protein [Clostridia bacterium]
MEKLLVSACLLGCACRYDGGSVPNEEILELKDRYELIPVCPEQSGGLPTPRVPSERVGDRVLAKNGADVTEAFIKGAETALYLAKTLGASAAVLKARSPSCGKGEIYDGSFSGTLTKGDGVTAALLEANGVPVFTEENLAALPKNEKEY